MHDLQAMEMLVQERRSIDKRVADVQAQLDALDAYDQARAGINTPKKIVSHTRERFTRSSIVELISSSADGMTRSQILSRLNVKGDTAKERAVTNSIWYLKRAGVLSHVDGVYQVQKKE